MPKSGGTVSETKKHVYVPFSERVAKIRIDPVRRIASGGTKLAEASDSYFITALDHWNELNMATNFTDFAASCSQYAVSLPMLLHNKSEVSELLLLHISRADVYSAEPLLDLITRFAHDLGPDFEPYFPKTLQTLIDVIVASSSSDSSLVLVEQAFQALAYLLKYLSRLLTTDLRPTFDFLSSLFGKTNKQRSFVLKFAAESIAFLVRKTSGDSLKTIIRHIVHDLEVHPSPQYYSSLATLLSLSLQSTGVNLHSKAGLIISEILVAVISEGSSGSYDLLGDVLVSALDHARKDTAAIVYETVLSSLDVSSVGQSDLSFRLLFVLAGMRKGDRVSDWQQIWSILIRSLESQLTARSIPYYAVLASAAIISYSDFATTQRNIKPVQNVLLKNDMAFYQVSELVQSISTDAFRSFLAGPILKHTLSTTAFSGNKQMRTLALVRIKDVLNSGASLPAKLRLDLESWLELEAPTSPAEAIEYLMRFEAYDGLGTSKYMKESTVLKILSSQLVERSRGLYTEVVGRAIASSQYSETLSDSILNYLPKLEGRATLLKGLHRLYVAAKNVPQKTFDQLIQLALPATTSPDVHIRGAALELCSLTDHGLITECIAINSIPFDVQNARSLAMRIRTLSSRYQVEPLGKVEIQVVPRFFFALVAAKFEPVWKAALEAVPLLAERSPDIIMDLARNGILYPSMPELESVNLDDSSMTLDTLEEPHFFEGTALSSVQASGLEIFRAYENVSGDAIRIVQGLVTVESFDGVRSAALKSALQEPRLAEKFGDDLVALLLRRGDDEDGDGQTDISFRDRITLLELFSKFRKPKKLTRFPEVYERYLYFLGSKHRPIQLVALKCVLSVNDPAAEVLRKYRDHFEALIDEKRYKDEVLTFFNRKSSEDQVLHEEDLSVVVPVALRVLYGRSQTVKHSGGSRANERHAALSAINDYLEPEYHHQFLQLAIPAQPASWTMGYLRRQQAMVHLFQDYLDVSEGGSGSSGILGSLSDVFRSLKTFGNTAEGELSEIDRKIAKATYQAAVKVLHSYLRYTTDFSYFKEHIEEIYDLVFEPRMESFTRDNTEQPSALMRFLAYWAEIPELHEELLEIKGSLSDAMAGILEAGTAKEISILLVLQFFKNLFNGNKADHLDEQAGTIMEWVPTVLIPNASSEILQSTVDVVRLCTEQFSFFGNDLTEEIVSASLKLLGMPNKSVNPRSKESLLVALAVILERPANIRTVRDSYEPLCPLFKELRDESAREALCRCFVAIGSRIPSFLRVSRLVVDLNANNKSLLGRPDFDTRLRSFEEINEKYWDALSIPEWRAILFNAVYFIRDPEELALRASAAHTLKRFLESTTTIEDTEITEHNKLTSDILLPNLKSALKTANEDVRNHYIELLGNAVRVLDATAFPEVSEMMPLLFDGDEEASFFHNVLHIQTWRRRRAVQTLKTLILDDKLTPKSLAHYVLPIVEHFVDLFGNKDGELNNLAQDSIDAIRWAAEKLTWNQYQALAKRYVSELIKAPTHMKRLTRLVAATGQALPSFSENSKVTESTLVKFVQNDVVPPLLKVMTARSNELQNLPERVALGTPVVIFIRALPEAIIEIMLPGKLSWLSQILRSGVPELRDMVRQTVGKIAKALGPRYLRYILQDLRSALRNGMQLHVLGYTAHYLLVELKNELNPGDLDHSADVLARIALQDILGNIGKEKESEGYTNSAKEVKQNKSYDTVGIVASSISLGNLELLIGPLKEFVLRNKMSSSMSRRMNELLRRILAGIQQNMDFAQQEALVYGYKLFEWSGEKKQAIESAVEVKNAQPTDRRSALEQAAKESEEFYTVTLSSRLSDQKGERTDNLHFIQSLAIELLRTVLSKEGLLTVANAKGLMPLMKDALESKHEEIQISSLRLAAQALKLPIAGIDDILETMGLRAIAVMKVAASSSSDLFQAVLKFVTMLLKYKSEIPLQQAAIDYILERIKPDIQEPDKQGSSIGFIRAVLSRKVMSPSVYGIMDSVKETMVTNQASQTRSACRSAYLQFLLEYPHGSNRMDKQFAFLVSNLQYKTSTGRLSVMEMVHMVLQRVDDVMVQTVLSSFFVSLVMVLLNDDVAECRENATKLLQELLPRADLKNGALVVSYIIAWLRGMKSNEALARAGLEITIVVKEFAPELLKAHPELEEVVDQTVVEVLKLAPNSGELADWQLLYFALRVLEKQPQLPLEVGALLEPVLLFPHPWVRASAGRLLGSFYARKRDNLPFSTEQLVSHAKRFVRQLRAPRLANVDGTQIVKNLVFVANQLKDLEALVEMKESDPKEFISWLSQRLSSTLRSEIHDRELIAGKTAAIQVLASLSQLLPPGQTASVVQEALIAMLVLTEQVHEQETGIVVLAKETMDMFQKTLGTTEYLKMYSDAQRYVETNRLERRQKRSRNAILDPSVYAQKKMKRNFAKKESRKRVKTARKLRSS